MTAPSSFPSPRLNQSEAGRIARASGLAAADIIVAVGDYTAGAAEDMFTLASHGLIEGDHLHVLWQSAMGAVTGGEATRGIVHYLTTSTFQIRTAAGATIENTADGTVVFVKGRIPTQVVSDVILPFIIVADWDYTSGTVEDMGTPTQGSKGLQASDTLKLLYKSASGVTAGTADVTYYAKNPTVSYFQISATAGGAVIDSTADGLAVFLKTS